MKKTLVIVIALILIMAFAAGCGNKNESTGNTGAGAATEEGSEEVARGSASAFDAIDVGDVTLDDINILDDDSEVSFRAGSHQIGDDWESASAN